MPIRRLLVWILAGAVGLAAAAGVSLAASHLSSQRIGLEAEPLTAGEALAPSGKRGGSPSSAAPAGRARRSGDDRAGASSDEDRTERQRTARSRPRGSERAAREAGEREREPDADD
jgi:hypothetical protein